MDTALYTAEAGFDKAAIMRAAWASFYRQANRGTTVADRRKVFAFHLRTVWTHARNLRDYAIARAATAQAEAEHAAVVRLIPRAERLDRAAQLERAAYGIECSDRNGSTMHRAYALRTEAEQLRAA